MAAHGDQCMAMVSLAPSERCGEGIVAGREGICWSVVSNGLRCSGQAKTHLFLVWLAEFKSSTSLSILCIAGKPLQTAAARHRNAGHASHCDATVACPLAL
jgi:hypothetical protein